jgi:hypothetical protein
MLDDLRNRTDIFIIHSSRDPKEAHESYKTFSAKWKKPKEYSVADIETLDKQWQSACHERVRYHELRSSQYKHWTRRGCRKTA